jgi:hypothetical protein
MALRPVQVNFKARDHEALGRFWADALGWALSSEGPGVTNVEPVGEASTFGIDVVSVPNPQTVRYRAHLDLASSSLEHQASLVAHLKSLGATDADVGQGDVPWKVLADPEGTVFCVLEPRPMYADTGPIAALVVHCANPRAMVGFWNDATDWTTHEVTDEFAQLRSSDGVGPYLEFVRSPDPDGVPTRVHIDLRPYAGDDQSAEVARLLDMGAAQVDIGQGDAPWKVLTDPEGNEFCVLTPGT